MLTDKDLGIKKLILNRLDQITAEAEADPEYKNLGERPNQLLELAAAKLPLEDKALLEEYDDVWFAQICRSRRADLQRGVDGWDLAHIICATGIGSQWLGKE